MGERSDGGESSRVLHRNGDDADGTWQETIEVAQQRGFAHAPAAVDQEPGAAGRQHHLPFELAEHVHPRNECFLGSVDWIASPENLWCGFLAHDALNLGQLTLCDSQPIVCGGAELRSQGLLKAADTPAKVLDLLDHQRRIRLAMKGRSIASSRRC